MRSVRPMIAEPSEPSRTDVPSLEEVFARYSSYVAAIGWSLLGRDHEVDDLVQDVFVIAAKKLKTVRNPSAIKAWLATTAVRGALRKLRFRRALQLFMLERPSRPGNESSGSASDRVLLGEVQQILERFPDRQRAAWILRRIQEEPLDEVARLCDCSLATAKRRIDEVDAWLKDILA